MTLLFIDGEAGKKRWGFWWSRYAKKKIDSKNRLYPHSEDELERMLELFKENVEQYGDFWSVIFARSVEYIFSSEIRLADIS